MTSCVLYLNQCLYGFMGTILESMFVWFYGYYTGINVCMVLWVLYLNQCVYGVMGTILKSMCVWFYGYYT